MQPIRHLMVIALAGICAASASSAFAVDDPSGRFVPGKYFEYKAQFYLKNRDYRAALEMFELAGYWANKIAQYNVGIMYFNGIGSLPVDKIRGVAWLGIAAEQHGELADAALHAAYAELTPEQRTEADGVFRQLDAKYGDAVTLPRALNRYEEERRNITGSHAGFVGNMIIQQPDGSFVSGNRFYADQKKEFDDYISTSFGHVNVGALKPLDVPASAKANASTERLETPSQKSPAQTQPATEPRQ
ncbi:MAG: hypothetical protein P4L92_06530 [Rudaea sp.]|nr:hypothetical protein [Rudaea sp.]